MSLVLGCACNTGNGNTGLPNCVEQFGLASGLALQPIVANDGSLNRINLAVASITTEWTSLLTQTNRTKRIYPITGLKNVDFPKEDTQYETDNTNQKEKVRDGVQSFVGQKWKVSPVFVSKVRQGICSRNGAWILTPNGVVGVKKSDGYWYPIEVAALDAQYMFQKGDAVSKMNLTFDFEVNVNVGELWLVSWSDLNTTYAAQVGLIDVNFEETTAPSSDLTNTTFGLRLTTDYGQGLLNNQTVDGLTSASFTIYNETASASITPVSVTEVADDEYTFVIPDQTASDVVSITLVTSTGYEGSTTITAV